MATHDQSSALIDAVKEAHSRRTPLAIHGGNTKQFYGRPIQGKPLDVSEHGGIIRYEPTELVLTARSGTPLIEIEKLLTEHQQMLAFEPPYFGENATLGGVLGAGLAGPRRPYGGAVRDNVLGVEIINGAGDRLRFGGEVMKNVAGYDLARTMAGALGTLGVLLQISVKVLPLPTCEITVVQTLDSAKAIKTMSSWAARPLPISATWYDGHDLYVRLSGGEQSVRAAAKIIGGDILDWGKLFWQNIKEQGEAFFMEDPPLWRIAVPPSTPPLHLSGKTVMEWNGALRWLKSDAPAEKIRSKVTAAGGHTTLFRGGDRSSEVFQALPPALMKVHKNLKKALDPEGILNPQRMYPEL